MRDRLPAVLLLIAALGPVLRADDAGVGSQPRVVELTARAEQGRTVVAFRLEDALTAEVLERVASGLPLVFRHQIELVGRRPFPLTPRRVLARTRIETRVEYDSLSGRYSLFRRTERRRPEERQTVPSEERRTTDSVDAVRAWMTELRVPLDAPGTSGTPLKVRVQSSVGRRYVLLIFPARVTASAELVLER